MQKDTVRHESNSTICIRESKENFPRIQVDEIQTAEQFKLPVQAYSNPQFPLMKLISLDPLFAQDLLQDRQLLDGELCDSKSLFYPSGQMTSASIVGFNNTLQNDTFLALLQDSYRNTKRKEETKLRISIIFHDVASTPCTIEFPTDRDYWGVISSIRCAVEHGEAFFTARCKVTSASSIAGTSEPFQPLSARISSSGLYSLIMPNSSSGGSLDWQCITISTTKVSISNFAMATTSVLPPSAADIMTIDIRDIKALVLAADYEVARKFLIEATLSSLSVPASTGGSLVSTTMNNNTNRRRSGSTSTASAVTRSVEGLCLAAFGSDDKIISTEEAFSAVLTRTSARDTVLVPVSEEEVSAGQTSSAAVQKVGILKGVKVSGTEGKLLATVRIPFSSFISNSLDTDGRHGG